MTTSGSIKPPQRIKAEPDSKLHQRAVEKKQNGAQVRPSGLEGFDLDAFMMEDASGSSPPQPSPQQQQQQQRPDYEKANYTLATASTSRSPTSSFNFNTDGFTTSDLTTNGVAVCAGSPEKRERSAQAQEQEQTPAWTELKTKAGKDRKRLPLACIACRRKKIRCSGEKPACKHCSKSRIPCVYKVTLRKPAPRIDYMTMLDKRLKRMEERVLKTIPREDLKSMPGVARAVVRPSSTSQQQSKTTLRKRSAKEAFSGGLDQWAKGPGTGYNSVDKRNNSLVPQPRQWDERSLLIEGVEHLPSVEIQEHLVQTYFDYVYGQSYPLLHKPSFMRRLEAGDIAPVLMLAVCALSARFSDLPELQTEPEFLRGEAWANAARDISLRRFETPNLTVLIVYLLLGLHEFGTCRGGRSWMYGGMAHRMAYALLLHKDLEYDPLNHTDGKPTKLSPIDREIRRRVMWSCFLMDRFNSSGTVRPMFANEQYLNLQLPIKESLFLMEIPGVTENLDGSVTGKPPSEAEQMTNAKANMGASAYAIRIVAIWGRFVQYFNLGGRRSDPHPMWSQQSIYRKIVAQMEALEDSLPQFLQYNTENIEAHATENIANQFLYMHILYWQTILFANRFAFPATSTGHVLGKMPNEFLSNARSSALNAATMISNIIGDSDHYRLVVPFAGYSAYLSSAVHVHGAFSKNQALQASSRERLAINVKYLTKMKKRWGMFHYLTEQLKDSYRQHADAAVGGISTPTLQGQTKTALQYGDWYDKYPHGVSRADYEEPEGEPTADIKDETVLAKKSPLQSVEEFFRTVATSASNRNRGRGGPKKRQSGRGGKAVIAATAANVDSSSSLSRQQHATQQASPLVAQSHSLGQRNDYRNNNGIQTANSHLDSMELPPALAPASAADPTSGMNSSGGHILPAQQALVPPPQQQQLLPPHMGIDMDPRQQHMSMQPALSAGALNAFPSYMPHSGAAAASAAAAGGPNANIGLMWEGMDLGAMSMMNMPEFPDFGLTDPTGLWFLPYSQVSEEDTSVSGPTTAANGIGGGGGQVW